jgi:hypothetical protein
MLKMIHVPHFLLSFVGLLTTTIIRWQASSSWIRPSAQVSRMRVIPKLMMSETTPLLCKSKHFWIRWGQLPLLVSQMFRVARLDNNLRWFLACCSIYVVVHWSPAVPFKSFLPWRRFICWHGDPTYRTVYFRRWSPLQNTAHILIASLSSFLKKHKETNTISKEVESPTHSWIYCFTRNWEKAAASD